jgi:hypothetical protein
MNKIYWFTNSYRENAAKFPNNLLNEEKKRSLRQTVALAAPLVRRTHRGKRVVATD